MSVLAAFAVRCLLVVLFLPFSALDKLLNFRGAASQAAEVAPAGLAGGLILLGLAVEVLMPLGILTGTADRAAAFVMAGYCGVTAILWKRFWQPGDFWAGGKGRELFWDFLKNFSLAGGFLVLAFGTSAASAQDFLRHPFASSHPYSVPENGR